MTGPKRFVVLRSRRAGVVWLRAACAGLCLVGVGEMTHATASDIPSARVVSSVKSFEVLGEGSELGILLGDGRRYTLRRQDRVFEFWRKHLGEFAGDPTDAVYVDYDPATRVIRELRLTTVWEGVVPAEAPVDGRLRVTSRVSAALYSLRADRPEYPEWKAILDEAAATQKTVRVAFGEPSNDIYYVGWSGPQRPRTDVARVQRFDEGTRTGIEEAVLLAHSGWRFVLRRGTPDFQTWRERIGEALRDGLPLRVEYDPSTRHVLGILRVLRRRVLSVSSSEASRESRVTLDGDASAFLLREETVPLAYKIWRRDLETAARSGEAMFIAAQPETREILLAVKPY